MRLSFEILFEPVKLTEDKISVLKIENKSFFRQIISALLNGNPEEHGIIFSLNFEPLKFKGNISVITDYYNLTVSSSLIRKIYDAMECFCVNEMPEETAKLKMEILKFTELLTASYDYDFSDKDDVCLTDLFKMQNIKPNINNSELLEDILEYILLIQKYMPQKLFIFVNLHSYFSEDELNIFFYEMIIRKIRILDIESSDFDRTNPEELTIIDKDLCVI